MVGKTNCFILAFTLAALSLIGAVTAVLMAQAAIVQDEVMASAALPDEKYLTEMAATRIAVIAHDSVLPYEPTLYALRRTELAQIDPSAAPELRGRFMAFMATETALASPYRLELITLTPPYEPTLYAQRRTQEYYIMASMGPTEGQIFAATERALIATYQGTVLPSETPTPIPTRLGYMECSWQWARQALPTVGLQAQTALEEAEIHAVTVRAEAYGENCLDQKGEVNYFAAMTTDFYLTVPNSNLRDPAALADQVVQIVGVLKTLPQENWPARPGYLDMTLTDGVQSRVLRTTFDEVQAAINQGKTGEALFDALNQ